MSLMAVMMLVGCNEPQHFSNDARGNFEALWKEIDEHYCFFEYKGIDWDAVGAKYRARVYDGMSNQDLFGVCGDMVRELRDGHSSLSCPWDVAQYRIWDEYPANYDVRVINEHYLHFDYRVSSSIKYQVLKNNFGYMYYGSFENAIGEGNLDMIISYLASTDGLIIDVRDNSGGYLTNVETLVGRFINEEIHAGAIRHKTGPGHKDFSEPFDYYFKPASDKRLRYQKPVVVLANRRTYSAANNFVSIMKCLPNVRVVGDTSGGGSGLPFTSELPNGWHIRFSACEITDPNGNPTEWGVEPSEGGKVDITPQDIIDGRDAIMERAFEMLETMKIR